MFINWFIVLSHCWSLITQLLVEMTLSNQELFKKIARKMKPGKVSPFKACRIVIGQCNLTTPPEFLLKKFKKWYQTSEGRIVPHFQRILTDDEELALYSICACLSMKKNAMRSTYLIEMVRLAERVHETIWINVPPSKVNNKSPSPYWIEWCGGVYHSNN